MYSVSFDNCSEPLIILYSYFQNEVNLTYPKSIIKGLIFLQILTSSKILSSPWTDFPYSVFTAISRLPLKNENLLWKEKRKSLYLVGYYLVMYLRCFDTVFQRPCSYLSNTLKVIFSFSNRYKIFTSDWLWIEVCQNAVLKAHCQPWSIARRKHKSREFRVKRNY